MQVNNIEENSPFGYIMLFRSLQNHWIWHDATKLKWWIDILLLVNWQDKKLNEKYKLVDCKRGQTIMSLENMAKRWGVDKSTVRRFLKMLQDDAMIETENLQFTTRITVCNYDSYNNPRHTKQLQSNRDATTTQPRRNTNNKDNNTNNTINIYSGFSVEEIEAYEKFKNWIEQTAPNVLKMKEEFTISDYHKSIKRFSKQQISETLISMHNWKDLCKKNVNPYLTMCQWIAKSNK
jgi:DNA-binding transcriptional regulator YhcF (GntR family)